MQLTNVEFAVAQADNLNILNSIECMGSQWQKIQEDIVQSRTPKIWKFIRQLETEVRKSWEDRVKKVKKELTGSLDCTINQIGRAHV